MAFNDSKKKGYTGYRLATDPGKGSEQAKKLQAKRDAAEVNAAGRLTNAVFAATDADFKAACEEAGIPATPRQAGKYRRSVGRAYEARLTLDRAAREAA